MKGLLENITKRKFGLRLATLSIILTIALFVVACGETGSPPDAPAPQAVASGQSQGGPREIPVSGSLVFPNTVSLSFDTPGIVGEVLVSEGDVVQNGQALAALDAQSTAQLETDVAHAQLRVTTAENSLNALRLDPHVQIAGAELEVASAEVALDEAQDALDHLLQRPGINVAAAQFAAAQAEIALDDARTRLDDLLTPQQIAVSAVETKVAAARVALDNAQEAYDDIKDGSYPEEVLRDARNGAAFAATALETANRTRTDGQAAAQNALMQAEDAEYLIREQYVAHFKYWFGTEPTDAEMQMTSQQVIAEWGIDLDATFFRFNPDYVDLEPTSDNPDTRWFEPTIWAWMNLHPQFGGVVPTCSDEDPIARTERCITRELENGYDALDRARDALAAVRNNAATTDERTEDAVAAAQAALADAQDALEEIEEGPDASLVESAEKRLQLAQASLQEAEDDLAELTVDIDPLNVTIARAAVSHAEVAFEEANDAVDRARDDSLHIERSGKRLELTSAAVIDAETRFNSVVNVVQDQIRAAETELALAQATLAEAQEALDGAVVRSTIDGVVSLVNIEPDDPVGDEMSVIDVISTDVVEIDGVIDAAGRPYVSEGASAIVSIESVGDTALNGSVNFIGKEARTERGVISYAVRIRVEVPAGVNVPISLSGASAIIIGSDTALLNGSGGNAPAVASYRTQPSAWQSKMQGSSPSTH